MTRTHRYRGADDKQRGGCLVYPMSMHARGGETAGSASTASTTVAAPVEAEREQMAALAIDFVAGVYRFESMRFDRLADAVGHARFAMRHQEDAGGR